jgi:CHAD domain-containing protein
MARARTKPAAELLALAPLPAVARIALGLLDAAAQAHARLRDDTDAEALHDLRVALRRLRSLLRAYRPWLARSLPRKLRRRLKRLARATNEARDAEVQLAWLAQQRLRLSARERVGAEWLKRELSARRARAYRHVREELTHEFVRLEAVLRAAFTRAARPARTAPQRFGQVTAQLIAEHVEALRVALAGIASPDAQPEIHAARIAAKRLRYLVEPVAPLLSGGRERIERLKRFQDDFGLLNDSFVRARALAEAAQLAGGLRARHTMARALGAAATPGAEVDALAGLLRLASAVQRESRARYAQIERRYLHAAAGRFVTAMLRVATELARAPGAMR